MDSACGKLARAVIGLLLLVVDGTTSLQNLKITAPERVRVGDSALLTCSYDLEDAQLYTIKWYLDDHEFYRFVPKKDPAHNTFAVRNIQVNVSSSNMQDVTLVNMRRNHTGRYKCEVSEDYPRYDTKIQEADVLVVDVPETEPRIAVDRQHLPAGETLRANCTSGASHPAPNITWTLNGAPLNNQSMKFHIYTRTLSKKYEDKKQTYSTLNLDTSGLFRDGRLRLRCFAEITPVYKVGASLEITEDGPYLASITGDASPHSRQSSGCGRVGLPPSLRSVLALSLVLGLLLLGAASTR